MHRSLAAQRDFRAVYAKHPRIAARRRMRPRNGVSGEKAQFHQALCIYVGHVDTVENTRLALLERSQVARPGRSDMALLIETYLHPVFIMALAGRVFNCVLQVTCN